MSEYVIDYDALFDAPGAIREQVVRCKDCRKFHLDNSDHDYRSGWWCDRWDTDMVKPGGYCAWGERRADHD